VSEIPARAERAAAAVKTVGAIGTSSAIAAGRMAVLPASDHSSSIKI
jgi:hypothetical protein